MKKKLLGGLVASAAFLSISASSAWGLPLNGAVNCTTHSLNPECAVSKVVDQLPE